MLFSYIPPILDNSYILVKIKFTQSHELSLALSFPRPFPAIARLALRLDYDSQIIIACYIVYFSRNHAQNHSLESSFQGQYTVKVVGKTNHYALNGWRPNIEDVMSQNNKATFRL